MADALSLMLPDVPHIVAAATLMPEIMTGASAIILLLGGVYAGPASANRMQALALFVMLSLFGMMCVTDLSQERMAFFAGMFVTDGFTYFVKMLLVGCTVLALLMSDRWLAQPENRKPEFPVLMLFSLLGMMLMVSANDLLALYMGMELAALPLYVLAAFSRDSLRSTEAGIKYFVLGALSSGLFLFGTSLIYGFAGSTNFTLLAQLFGAQSSASLGVLVGLILVITAFCFKSSAAPFHMWTPDVYQGAPTPVTAFFSIAPKLAALAVFLRLLLQPFMALAGQWEQVVIVVSLASMLVGALGALTQTNIKRLLAYSSIGHVGYALMGLAAGTQEGAGSVLLYLALYIVMSAGTFAIILMMNRGGEPVENISDLAGLSRSQPRTAFALGLFMFSMAGIPPLAGFFGKMYVFLAALHAGLIGLAVAGVLLSVIACYYYLKVVKTMYFDEPAPGFDAPAKATRLVALVCAAITLFFFLLPGPLVVSAQAAAEALFK